MKSSRRPGSGNLIDKTRAHLWKPLLHEIAAGSMDLGVHEFNYLAQSHWHHFRYRLGEMVGLNRERLLVRPALTSVTLAIELSSVRTGPT